VFNESETKIYDFLKKNNIKDYDLAITNIFAEKLTDRLWHLTKFSIFTDIEVEKDWNLYIYVEIAEDFEGERHLRLRLHKISKLDIKNNNQIFEDKLQKKDIPNIKKALRALILMFFDDNEKTELLLNDIDFNNRGYFGSFFNKKIETDLPILDCFMQSWFLKIFEEKEDLLKNRLVMLEDLKKREILKKFFSESEELLKVIETEENWREMLELSYGY
jgi:hypothetical protein